MTTDPTAAGCTNPCIACMTDESHDPAPNPAETDELLRRAHAQAAAPADRAGLHDQLRAGTPLDEITVTP